MGKQPNRRKRILIDQLQYQLLVVNIAYFFIILLIFVILLYAPLVMQLNSDGPYLAQEHAAQQFLFLDERVWLPLLLTFSCLTVHSIFMSHRIAGPLYQLRRLLDAVGDGNLAVRATLREKDYLRKEEAAINTMIDKLSRRISFVEKRADELRARLGGGLRAAITSGTREEVLSQLGTLDEIAESLNSALRQFKIRRDETLASGDAVQRRDTSNGRRMIAPSITTSSRFTRIRLLRDRLQSWKSTPSPRPVVVAIAAPVSPSSGKGPIPKISIGSSTMLIPFASHTERMAIVASPAPR